MTGSLLGGGFEQVCDHFLHVVVVLQIGEGIVTMAFLHVQKVYHLDLVAHPFQQAPAVAQQFALTVQHKVRDMGRLEQVGLCIEPAFSCSAATAYQGIERPAVLFSRPAPYERAG